jgi:hypothetical protein
LIALGLGACTAGGPDGGSGFGSGHDVDTGEFESDSGPEVLDVAEGGAEHGTAEAGEDDGCRAVDFLFVIDDSASMDTAQTRLIESFPQFAERILSTLKSVESHHVGVITSDAYAFNEAGCQTLGALVTQTGGLQSSKAQCGPFAQGHRYMDEYDDLASSFACAAKVGTDGDNEERMIEAALAAVSPEQHGEGACNEGFVRDDAILVLVLVTNEDDPGTCDGPGGFCDGSEGDPLDWFEAFADLKGGDADDVVVLSLVRGVPENACADPIGAEKDGSRVMEFSSLFGDNGLVGDLCAESFGSFFDDAVGLIDSVCLGQVG